MIVPTISIILIVLLSIFIFAPLKIKIIYRRQGQNDYAGLELLLFWELLPVRVELTSLQALRRAFNPLVKIKTKITSKLKKPVASRKQTLSPSRLYRLSWRNLYYLRLFRPALTHTARKTKLTGFRWETQMGFEDAAATGMAVGALWTLKGLFSSTLYRLAGKHENLPRLEINPVFNQKIFNTEIDCIFVLRPGHIIISFLIMLKIWLFSRVNPGSEQYA
jgi:hypothetical protein